VTITKSDLKKAAEDATKVTRKIKINGDGDTVDVTFSKLAVDWLNEKNSDVYVSLVDKDLSAALVQAAGGRPVYKLGVALENKDLDAVDFGYAVVGIPYQLKEDEDPNGIMVRCWNDETQEFENLMCWYDIENATVRFMAVEMGYYTIVSEHKSFEDSESGWWVQSGGLNLIDFLVSHNITSGTSPTTYSPNATLTREQYVTLVMRTLGITVNEDIEPAFSDTADGSALSAYVNTAHALGIAYGNDGVFGSKDPVTREQMFAFTLRALKTLDETLGFAGDLPTERKDGLTLESFPDVSSISGWAAEEGALEVMLNAGICNGKGSVLDPTGLSTRAELAAVLYKLITSLVSNE